MKNAIIFQIYVDCVLMQDLFAWITLVARIEKKMDGLEVLSAPFFIANGHSLIHYFMISLPLTVEQGTKKKIPFIYFP